MKRRKVNKTEKLLNIQQNLSHDVVVFDIQNLPLVPFRRVMDFLSVTDTLKLRCLSRWFDERVTWLRKFLLKKFYIFSIDKENCEQISISLFRAMAKLYAPEKLRLGFSYCELNPTTIQILVDYKDIITHLDIDIFGNEEFLIQPSFMFKSLESLSLSPCHKENDDAIVSVCDALLAKHNNKLKYLQVRNCDTILSVPVLPKLDTLGLWCVWEDALWIILEQCRPTISSLELYGFELNRYSPNNHSSNAASYQLPNLKRLKVHYPKSNPSKFVTLNAEHLVSLELILNPFGDYFQWPQWPQFPNLKELNIDSEFLHILSSNKETIECLVLNWFYDGYNHTYAIETPRLTDLYLYKSGDNFTKNILTLNHNRLEFLYLRDNAVPNPEDMMKMETVRTVVLDIRYSDQDRYKMSVMCPNAWVLLVNKENELDIRCLVKSRCKRKNFLMDTARFIKNGCYNYEMSN